MPKFRPAIAMREHMLGGHSITLLEAILLFGVQGPNAELGRMRRDGYLIGSQLVSMASVIARINTYTVCKVPDNLPFSEIKLKEYWIKT